MQKQYQRVVFPLFIAFFLTAWIAVNMNLSAGIIYSSFIIISILAYTLASILKFPLIGIGAKWVEETSIGFVLGGILISFSIFFPQFIIGYPQATTDVFIIVGGVAPVVEEVAFRGVLMNILDKYMPFYFALILSAVFFSIFHWTAYGISMTSAFVGAFIFGLIAGLITKWRRSIIPAIILHATFNIYLLLKPLIFI